MNQPELVKMTKEYNPREGVNVYIVKYNGKTIGSVTRWESYLWSANPNWDGIHLISDSRNRKTAVARLVEAHKARVA